MTAQTFGVLAHPTRPQTAPVGGMIADSLREAGMTVWSLARWTEDDVSGRLANTDMVIAIGGDGAMLRAGRVCGFAGVPVLGVNMGKLGFLTEVAPDAWPECLPAVLNGAYWIERRMMISAEVIRDGAAVLASDALNDVVISRGGEMGLLQMITYIDGGWTTTYNADALIVATATGSTAYALACGGPILPPEQRSILLVPVAPHLSLDRPIVLAEGSTVDIRVGETRTKPFLAVDGATMYQLQEGDILQVKASTHVGLFARLREKTYFYRSLLDRLEPRVSNEPR